MPKLRGEQIPRAIGRNQEQTTVHDNEIMVGCPLIKDCGWRSIRPLAAAHSAQVAHVIQHRKGMR